jgi:hypothetical protein
MMNKAPGTLECFRSFLLKIRGNYPVLKLKIHRVYWVKFPAKPRKNIAYPVHGLHKGRKNL